MQYPKYIIHIDMDAFYASIEQLENPHFRNKPLIIGGGDRGVVSTCSYEARKFGVRSAMPTHQAKALCPHAIFIPPRMSHYLSISKKIHSCLQNFSPLVEMASIDEAYVDITGMEKVLGTPEAIGKSIQNTIFEITGGLTCSIGIAPLKFLAKIASDENKPHGLFQIKQEDMQNYLAYLPVNKIPGVGKKFYAELQNINIRTCADVIKLPQSFWEMKFKKSGLMLYQYAQGVDTREVEPYTAKKSESAESTLDVNTHNIELLKKYLLMHAERVGASLRKSNLKGRTITLKVKYSDFQQITRQTGLSKNTNNTDTIFHTACTLLNDVPLSKKVRLIGLGVSNFSEATSSQASLFDIGKKNTSQNEEEKLNKLDSALDNLRSKYGKGAIIRGRLFNQKKKDM